MSYIKHKNLSVKTGTSPAFKKEKHCIADAVDNPVPNGVSKSGFNVIPVAVVKGDGRKKTGTAISHSEEKLKLVMNAALDAIICINTSGEISFWNPQAEAIFGWTENEALGHQLSELIIPEQYRKRHNEGMALYLKTGNGPALNKLLELSAVKRSGEEFPIELTIMPIKQEVEEFFCAFVRDITERKKSEAALQKAYEEKNMVLERIDDGFFAVDENSIVTYWNKRAEILLNAEREDMIGKNLHEVFTTPGSIAFYNNYQKAIREKTTVHFVEFSERTNKWFAVSAYASDSGLSVYFKDVTEQKNAEEKLKESELRYRSIIEQATDAICIADASMKIIDVNLYCCQMLGYTKEEFLPLTVADLFVQEDLKENPFKIGELMSGKVIRNERRFKRKDGTLIEVEMSGRMLEDGRFILFGHDIAERKKAEDKIKESELRYRSLNEQSTDTICILDSAFKFIEINPSGCNMFGCTKEEVLQFYMTDVLFEEDLKTNPIKIDELKAGKVTSNERRIKRKDGSAILVEISSKMLEDGRVMVFGRDISERKEAERLIKESEAKYRSFFESSMDGILLKITDGEILSANPAACEIFKMTEEEICATGRSGVMDSQDPRVKLLLEEQQRTGKAKGELTMLRKDGSKFEAELTSAIFIDSFGQNRTSMIVRDITERKQAEQRIKESNERYNLISQATNDMVWDWDLVKDKVYRNKEGWKKIFRTGCNDIKNESEADWDNRVHPEDKRKVKEVKHEIQKSLKDFFEVECRVLRDDGSYAYIHERGNIIRNETGKAVRLIGATQDITARKEAELQVAKSELRFRSLVQNSSDLISILDEKAYYLYSSSAVKKVLGYDPEFMTGKNAFSFIHPDDIVTIKSDLAKEKTGKNFEVSAFRFKNKKGEWRWLETKITDMRDNPEVQGYVFNSRDVTERKIAEAEIEKLSFIARETTNIVIITNPEGEIAWVNEGFTKITEFELEEVMGRKPGDFLQGEETNLAVVRYMRKKLKQAVPFECDIINYSKSGRKYWLRIQCQPQFDESGKLKYFFAIETDITKEKEAEEILKASEERYRYLFNNNPASIFIWDIENFQILEVNDTAVGLYGYCREEFLTKTAFDLTLSQEYNKIKHFASIARQKNEFSSEVTCKHINKSGSEMYMHISSHLIQLKGRSVILVMATNITDKVILEHELENERRLKQQEITSAVITAQEKERQELGSELHDNINQILAGSRLYLGLAKKELNIDHPHLNETDSLIFTAINEIRNLSHSLIAPSLQESELLAAIENIIHVTQKTSGIMISLQACGFDETDMPDKLKLSIYRIIQEQFNNILKHAGAQKVIVRLIQEKEKTLLSIKDDGIGFDTHKKANGVGLMNIKTRASLFNGELTMISSPGNGCELRVLFN